MTDERYPVGRYDVSAPVSPEQVAAAIRDVCDLPAALAAAIDGLDDGQLDTPYRSGGWTVRQVVHHLADSHLNGYVRLRLALTEDRPAIRSYEQQLWAELPDAAGDRLEPSLSILDGLHARWSSLLDSLEPRHFKRPLTGPEGEELTIGQLICLYGWHSRHHVAHVTALRRRRDW